MNVNAQPTQPAPPDPNAPRLIDSIENTLKAEIGYLKTQLAEERGVNGKLQSKVDQLEKDISLHSRVEKGVHGLLRKRLDVLSERVNELEEKGINVDGGTTTCEKKCKALFGNHLNSLENRYHSLRLIFTARGEESDARILKNSGDIEAINSAIYTILEANHVSDIGSLTFKQKMHLFTTHICAQIEQEKRIGKTLLERMSDPEDGKKEYRQGLNDFKKWTQDEMEKWKIEMKRIIKDNEGRYAATIKEVKGKAGIALDTIKERFNDITMMMEEFQVGANLKKEEFEITHKEHLSTIRNETSRALDALGAREKGIQVDQESFSKGIGTVRDEMRKWKEEMALGKKDVQEQREELKEIKDDCLQEIRKAEDNMRNMIDRVEKGVGNGGGRGANGKVCTVISWEHGGAEDWYS